MLSLLFSLFLIPQLLLQHIIPKRKTIFSMCVCVWFYIYNHIHRTSKSIVVLHVFCLYDILHEIYPKHTCTDRYEHGVPVHVGRDD